MKFADLFNKNQKEQKPEIADADTLSTNEEPKEDEVSPITKFKIIGALLLVGLSAGVAWWVQDSSMSQDSNSLKTDILADSGNTQVTQNLAQAAMGSSQTTQNMAASQDNGFTQEVTISNFAFTPSQVTIQKGQTVKWKNNDSVAHTVTGPDFSSTTLNSGDTFTYTFNDDATVQYHCSFHPQMTGTIVVGNGDASAALHAAAVEGTQQDSSTSEVINTETAPQNTGSSQQNVFPAALEETPNLPENTNIPNTGSSLEAEPMGGNQENVKQTQKPVSLKGGKLASSGPEDWLYVGLGALVLYCNRKKLLAVVK